MLLRWGSSLLSSSPGSLVWTRSRDLHGRGVTQQETPGRVSCWVRTLKLRSRRIFQGLDWGGTPARSQFQGSSNSPRAEPTRFPGPTEPVWERTSTSGTIFPTLGQSWRRRREGEQLLCLWSLAGAQTGPKRVRFGGLRSPEAENQRQPDALWVLSFLSARGCSGEDRGVFHPRPSTRVYLSARDETARAGASSRRA